MKGAYRVIVETRKVKYDFRIKRNITIFISRGPSFREKNRPPGPPRKAIANFVSGLCAVLE